MRCLSIILLVAIATAFAEYCEDLSCESNEKLLQVIRDLQEEREKYHYAHGGMYVEPKQEYSSAAVPEAFMQSEDAVTAGTACPQATCNICASNPCLNGGTCKVDANHPWTKYLCLCPDNFAGTNCEKNITCTSHSCGQNADCFVSNHQTNCVCKRGYSSTDPRRGCQSKVQHSCGSGDPHFFTFDSLRFDYMGTCPYVYSEPCGNLTNGFANYKVVAKNKLIQNTHVSFVDEVEVTMYNQVVHIDGDTSRVFFNGFRINVPYYWPSKGAPKVKVTYRGGRFYVANDQLVLVTYTRNNGYICIQVPDVPEFRGNETLCGLAGNIDGIYKDDVVTRNGSVYPVTSSHMPHGSTADHISFAKALDTWITTDFMQLRVGDDKCITGEILANTTACDSQEAVNQCDPIRKSATGEGPFALCQGMGNDTIMDEYGNCVFDVCNGYKKCDVLTSFARQCMSTLPNTVLGMWRTQPAVNCPLTCPANSHYSTCTSSCPATCAESSAPDFCDQPCSEGCQCDSGYVIDNTVTSSLKCIPIQVCGCSDKNGNSHPANTPWLTNNCQIKNECRNGTFYSKINQCSPYANCGKDASNNMACVCKDGFTGDGYTCNDVNECLDPKKCSVDKHQGTCNNTVGSYNCVCNQYYDGHDCQYYHPRRHCADLYKYWGFTTTGVYTINPPYPMGSRPAFSNVTVYCDMDTDSDGQKGGWTLMTHDSGSGMVNKTYSQYEAGFGTPGTQDVWLGLQIINGMTQETNTSLLLNLYRCPHNGLTAKTTWCKYRLFSVDNAATNYTVTIPEVCIGSEHEYYDGWARWDLTKPGPKFVNFDTTDSPAFTCSKTFRNTGWWFDTTIRCGAADLNGVRYSCNNIPVGSNGATYLFWSGSPLGDAWLSLRPTAYPNYDPHPVTPMNWFDQ